MKISVLIIGLLSFSGYVCAAAKPLGVLTTESSRKMVPGKFELDILKDAGMRNSEFMIVLRVLEPTGNVESIQYLRDPIQKAFFSLMTKDSQGSTEIMALYKKIKDMKVSRAREFEELANNKKLTQAGDGTYGSEVEKVEEKYTSNITPLKEELKKIYSSVSKDLHYKLYHQAKIEDPTLLQQVERLKRRLKRKYSVDF